MLGRTLACAALGMLASTAVGAPFAIVREGVPAARIVLAEQPTPAARFAARELQLHIGRITGATVPIVSESRARRGPDLLVGESGRTRALGLRSDEFESQEYAIRFADDALVLIGCDRPADEGAGCIARGDGRFGSGLEFGGTGCLSLADHGFRDEAGSLECWVYLPAEPQPGEATILRLDGQGPWTYHILRRWPGTRSLGYTTYDGETVRGISSAELAEGWHHVLATYDAAAGRAELFVDGVSQGTAEYVRTTCAGSALQIGGIPGPEGATEPAGNPFVGRIDEVRVSSAVRAPRFDRAPEPDAETELLLHCDEPGGPPLDAGGKGRATTPLPGWYDDRGTLDAVYDFLERFCGVRWYMPTDLGTTYTESKSLIVDGRDVRRKPDMAYRWITPTPLMLPTKHDRIPQAETDLWRLRMRLGGEPYWVCHSFGGYPQRFGADHPDWFAQGHEAASQLCYTNDDVVRQLARDARDFFDGKGRQPGDSALGEVFGIVPMDDNRWCGCPRCQAELDAAEAGNPQFSNGRASRYVWGFVNRVAAEVRTTHPHKRVGALAYWEYAYPPEGIELEPNVSVQMCLHTRNWWCPSMEANDRRVFDSWVAREGGKRPLYVWIYYCFPALQAQGGQWNAFPSYNAGRTIEQAEMYRRAGIRGIFLEHSSEFGESHLMDVPDLYLAIRLAADAGLDGRQEFAEFFTRFYGAAAEPMEAAYRLIEQTYSSPESYPAEVRESPAHQHQTEELAWRWLGAAERLDRLEALVAEARDRAGTELERRRVALFERGIVEYMREGKRAYEAKQAAPAAL